MALIEKTSTLTVGYDLIDNDHDKTRVDKGMITFGRSFVRDRLPQWFGLHVTTMDSALVAHIKIQSEK